VADLSKRFGNLKGGAKDIKCHRFFKKLVWDHLIQKKLPAPYKPPIKFVWSAFV
jgi:protein kinase A